MPKPFSDDLRVRILQAYEREEVSLAELAQRFAVKFEYVRNIRKQQLRTGRMERTPQERHGPISRVTEGVQEQIRSQLRAQPDLTVVELCERVQQATQVRLSRSHLGRWLQYLELRRKKNLYMHRNGTAKAIGNGAKNF